MCTTLEELDGPNGPGPRPAPPRLLDRLEELARRLEGRTPVVFLDYDGTLTPIVARPELARIDDAMRDVVRRLASTCTVAVVSGRDRADVEQLVRLEGILYAGSHGFDIRWPSGRSSPPEVGLEAVPHLDAVERELRSTLGGVDGAQIERKKLSMAVHYRNVADADVPRVSHAVDQAVADRPALRIGHGKKVLEIQPNVEWDKGRAVQWMLEALGRDDAGTLPIYVGDDVTDEDAFRVLVDRGLGVVVEPADRPSVARYRLDGVDEVRQLLTWLADRLGRSE